LSRDPFLKEKTDTMKTRILRTLDVSDIGYGTISFESSYGASPNTAKAIWVICCAHELGVTFFLTTAEAYGPFTNEELVGEALGTVRDEAVIAPKFGWYIDEQTGARHPGST
jgi:aryl-alcohol dehydrogenase-like predicted oxidoreductase